MNLSHSVLMVAIISIVTILLRALPFLIFGNNKKTPEFVTYLGKVLPYAIMGMLVVYCLKGINLVAAPHGFSEIISVSVVAGLHLWKRNTLLSIICGTVCYMVLIQCIF